MALYGQTSLATKGLGVVEVFVLSVTWDEEGGRVQCLAYTGVESVGLRRNVVGRSYNLERQEVRVKSRK